LGKSKEIYVLPSTTPRKVFVARRWVNSSLETLQSKGPRAPDECEKKINQKCEASNLGVSGKTTTRGPPQE